MSPKNTRFAAGKHPASPEGCLWVFADVTGGARYPPRLSREGKLELTEESRLAQP